MSSFAKIRCNGGQKGRGDCQNEGERIKAFGSDLKSFREKNVSKRGTLAPFSFLKADKKTL